MQDESKLQTLQRLRGELERLRAELNSLPRHSTYIGPMNDLPGYERRSSLTAEIAQRETAIQRLEREIAADEKRAAYHAALASADTCVAQAGAALAATLSRLESLLGQCQAIVARRDALEAEAGATVHRARLAEREAIAEYAKTLSADDAAGQQKADKRIQIVQGEVQGALARQTALQAVVTGLDEEAAMLRDQIESAREEARSLRAALSAAAARSLQAEWDEAVIALGNAGARYLAALRIDGRAHASALARDLVLRLFEPGRPALTTDAMAAAAADIEPEAFPQSMKNLYRGLVEGRAQITTTEESNHAKA